MAQTSNGEKFSHIHQILAADLSEDEPGGAIVYCATRRQAENIADFLKEKGVEAERFHAGLPPETKKNVQESFIRGELRAIVATNAFGMGIDKPDVRLVIHADIPVLWRTTFRRRAGPGVTSRRRGVSCSTRWMMLSFSSACRPVRG